jgi:hypothetical protein
MYIIIHLTLNGRLESLKALCCTFPESGDVSWEMVMSKIFQEKRLGRTTSFLKAWVAESVLNGIITKVRRLYICMYVLLYLPCIGCDCNVTVAELRCLCSPRNIGIVLYATYLHSVFALEAKQKANSCYNVPTLFCG